MKSIESRVPSEIWAGTGLSISKWLAQRGQHPESVSAPSSFWAYPAFWGHLWKATRPFSFNLHKKTTKKAEGNWGPSHSQLRCGRARTPAPMWAQPVLLVPAHITSSLHVHAKILPIQGVSFSPNTTCIFTTRLMSFPFSSQWNPSSSWLQYYNFFSGLLFHPQVELIIPSCSHRLLDFCGIRCICWA